MADSVNDAKENMEEADDTTGGLRERLGGLSGIQQKVGEGFDKMNAKAGFFGTALSFVTGAVSAVVGALVSLKALLIGGGLIAAVVALAIAWKENIGDIRGRVAALKEWLGKQFQALKETVLKIWNSFIAGFKSGGGDLQDLKTIFIAVLDGLEAGLKAWWKVAKPILMMTGKILIELAGIVGKAVGGIINWLAQMEREFGMITKIVAWVTALIAIFATAYVIVEVIAAVVGIFISLISVAGTLLSGLATVISVISTLISVFGTVVSVVATVIAALNPITLVIIAIIGIIIALYAAWTTNFLGIRDIVMNVVDAAVNKFNQLVAFLKKLPKMLGKFFNQAKKDAQKFLSFVMSIPKKIKNLVTNIGTSIARKFKDAFNQLIPDGVPIPEITIGAGVPGPDYTIGGGTLQIPQLASGGFVEESGVAKIHKGETVVPADVSRKMGMGKGGGGPPMKKVEINVGGVEIGDQSLDISNMSRSDLRTLAQEIATQLGDDVRNVVS